MWNILTNSNSRILQKFSFPIKVSSLCLLGRVSCHTRAHISWSQMLIRLRTCAQHCGGGRLPSLLNKSPVHACECVVSAYTEGDWTSSQRAVLLEVFFRWKLGRLLLSVLVTTESASWSLLMFLFAVRCWCRQLSGSRPELGFHVKKCSAWCVSKLPGCVWCCVRLTVNNYLKKKRKKQQLYI